MSPSILKSKSLQGGAKEEGSKKQKRARERESERMSNLFFVTSIFPFIQNPLLDSFVVVMITFVLDGMVSHLMQLLLSTTGTRPRGWPLEIAFNVADLARNRILTSLSLTNVLSLGEPCLFPPFQGLFGPSSLSLLSLPNYRSRALVGWLGQR